MAGLAELFKHYKDPNALENFKRWFGESKSVDELGNPIVFYHGSPNKGITEFSQFTPTFFTEDPKYAEMYANKGEKFGEIYPSFLKLELPFDPKNQPDIDFYNNKFIPFHKKRRPNDDVWPLEKGENIPFQWADQFIRFAKKEKNAGNVNYDSVYVDEGGFDKATGANAKLSIVPFENNQIKSATKNTGEFDANSNNIFRSHPIANAIGLTGLGKLLSEGQDVDLRGSINDYLSEGYDPAGLEKLTGVAPTVKRGDIAKEALEMTDIYAPMAAAEAYDAAIKGDWKGAGLSALGAIPLVGGMIKASHGSPHAFTKFDFSKIGTGEGAQAYGHGGYFAQGFDSPVAQEYQKRLSENLGATYKFPSGETYQITNPDFAIPFDDVMKNPKTLQNWTKTFENDAPEIIEAANILKRLGIPSEKITAQNPGHLYNVELRWPDAAREAADPLGEHHLLDWDAPLSEQNSILELLAKSRSKTIRDVLSGLGDISQPKKVYDEDFGLMTGEDLHRRLALNFEGKSGASKKASNAIAKAGIPGIRYLDQASRGAGEGTRNYVMFDDALANIVSRNGVSLSDLLRR